MTLGTCGIPKKDINGYFCLNFLKCETNTSNKDINEKSIDQQKN